MDVETATQRKCQTDGMQSMIYNNLHSKLVYSFRSLECNFFFFHKIFSKAVSSLAVIFSCDFFL